MTYQPDILIYGIGNPGRNDDGCGIVCVEEMGHWLATQGIRNVHCETNYQLNIEDAEMISGFDMVVFVDATIEPIKDIRYTAVDPSGSRIEFTMHAISPSFVLDLCSKLFGTAPDTYLLQIKGVEWAFREELSETGIQNVKKAVNLLKRIALKPHITYCMPEF